MLIEDQSFAISVLVPVDVSEVEQALRTVRLLQTGIEEGVTISILLNGGRSDALSREAANSGAVVYYESERALGDAEARNYLLGTDECRSADLILILAGKIEPPVGYIRDMASFLARNHEIGIAGPVAVSVKDHGLIHAGTHPDYFYAFLSLRSRLYGRISQVLRKFGLRFRPGSFLALNSRYRKLLRRGVEGYEVTSVAPGAMAFPRGLIEEIGCFDERFAGGFEEIDLAVRAKKAGRRNYIDARTRVGLSDEAMSAAEPGRKQRIEEYRYLTIVAMAHFRSVTRAKMAVLFPVYEEFLVRAISRKKNAHSRKKAALDGIQAGLDEVNSAGDSRPAARLSLGEVKADPHFQARNTEKLRAYRDRYRGRRCFIIGNGPSLNKLDLNLLDDEISFGVNGIFYKTDEMGFKPTFYMVEDGHVVDDNLERINAYDCEAKFFPHMYIDQVVLNRETMILQTDLGFYEKSHPHYRKPRFSKECDRLIYCGQTVTYMNMQLAYYMGFEEVYLLGMDFSYEVPPKEEMEGFTFTSRSDDKNHFHPDYFGKGKKWHDPKLHNVKLVYEHAKAVFEADGRRIINASVGGHLEVFERVDFLDIFTRSLSR